MNPKGLHLRFKPYMYKMLSQIQVQVLVLLLNKICYRKLDSKKRGKKKKHQMKFIGL